MRRINEAWHVLKDPKLRDEYDRLPCIRVVPTFLDFGEVERGYFSKSWTVLVFNDGGEGEIVSLDKSSGSFWECSAVDRSHPDALFEIDFESAVESDYPLGASSDSLKISIDGSATDFNLFVNVIEPPPVQSPKPSFNYSDSGLDLTVDASATAVDPRSKTLSFSWSWGDGHIDNDTPAKTVHTYARPDRYDVTLTVSNDAGPAMFTQTIQVDRPPLILSIGVVEQDGLFIEVAPRLTAGATASLSYDWGDGSLSTWPLHYYRSPGTHDLIVTAFDAIGPHSVHKELRVTSAALSVASDEPLFRGRRVGRQGLAQLAREASAGDGAATEIIWQLFERHGLNAFVDHEGCAPYTDLDRAWHQSFAAVNDLVKAVPTKGLRWQPGLQPRGTASGLLEVLSDAKAETEQRMRTDSTDSAGTRISGWCQRFVALPVGSDMEIPARWLKIHVAAQADARYEQLNKKATDSLALAGSPLALYQAAIDVQRTALEQLGDMPKSWRRLQPLDAFANPFECARQIGLASPGLASALKKLAGSLSHAAEKRRSEADAITGPMVPPESPPDVSAQSSRAGAQALKRWSVLAAIALVVIFLISAWGDNAGHPTEGAAFFIPAGLLLGSVLVIVVWAFTVKDGIADIRKERLDATRYRAQRTAYYARLRRAEQAAAHVEQARSSARRAAAGLDKTAKLALDIASQWEDPVRFRPLRRLMSEVDALR
jgi:PKD repeat protein